MNVTVSEYYTSLKAVFSTDERRHFVSQSRIVHFKKKVETYQDMRDRVHLESDCAIHDVKALALLELNILESFWARRAHTS